MINPPDDPALPDLPPPAQPVIVHVGPSRTWLVAFLVGAVLIYFAALAVMGLRLRQFARRG